MFKLTYLIIRRGQAADLPIAVKGLRTGRLYGHAQFDRTVFAHSFRIPSEDWDKGAGEDIQQFRAGIPPWIVKAEIEFDPSSAMGEQAALLDQAKAQVADLQAQLEAKDMELQSVRADLDTLAQIQSMAPEPTEKKDDSHGGNLENTPAQDAPQTTEQRLAGMKFPDLQKEAEDQNAKGASIDVKNIKSKIVLREALAEWYASRPQPEPVAA